jgi:hypothetical protein
MNALSPKYKLACAGYFEALRAMPGSARVQVAGNALDGSGARRGVSDIDIDEGVLAEPRAAAAAAQKIMA